MREMEPIDKQNKQNKQKVSKSNRVTARVWRSTSNDKPVDATTAVLAKGNVGHASLETDMDYLSHWPGDELTKKNKATSIAASSNTLVEDECLEGGNNIVRRSSESVEKGEEILANMYDSYGTHYFLVCKGQKLQAHYKESLYSLDKQKTEEEMRKIREEHNYILKDKKIGLREEKQKNESSLVDDDKIKEAANCSGATYRALAKGGINDLSTVCAKLADKKLFAITPADIENCVKDAKTQERKKYPQTNDFDDITNSDWPNACRPS
jgi:hypothetical protein